MQPPRIPGNPGNGGGTPGSVCKRRIRPYITPPCSRSIRDRAAKTRPSQWVVGFKYDDTKTSDGPGLAIADLDAAAPGHPVLVNHRGGHTSWVNSRALANRLAMELRTVR
jgi:hypothetical protein